jgi:putative membrane protein insertion efficiency factor
VNPLQFILLALLRFYRWAISPLLTMIAGGTICRFEPSCSAYAMEAVKTHGAMRGSWLTLRRLGRCHPWGGCGHDPVPQVQGQVKVKI